MKIDELRLTHPDTLRAMKNAWANMIRKCEQPRHSDYKYYGARGIKVCDRWHIFNFFVEDMGLRPEGLTLERQDNDGDYEPSNCVWATRQAQTENRRATALVEWQGRSMTVAAWEREFGWKAGVLKARLNRLGYTLEEAFTKSVKPGAKLETRQYAPRRKPDMSRVPRGLDNWQTKLTAEQVYEMRRRHADGESFSALGRAFGVTVTTASNAVQKLKTYKDV